MLSPLGFISRVVSRPPRGVPPVGRCPMCGEDVAAGAPLLRLRGGLVVHTACATYRTRQQSQPR